MLQASIIRNHTFHACSRLKPLVLVGFLLSAFLVPGCAPQARVEASVTSGQAPLMVSFTNTSKNADEFHWDFGDGATMTTSTMEQPVTHEYTKAGTHTVTLTAIKKGEPTKTSTMTLTVAIGHGALDRVKLSPERVELTVGQSQQFTAQALDAYDNPIPEAQITWVAAQEAGTITGTGMFIARTKPSIFPVGIVVTAEFNTRSVTATASVTLKHGPLDRVKLSPGTVELYSGRSQQFTAEAVDAYDNPIPEAQIIWETAQEVGTITANGMFSAGRKAGTFPKGIVAAAKLNSHSAQAAASVTVYANVALNAEVTLHGGRFFTGGWTGGRVVGEDTIVDGVFLPRSNQWNLGPVWWDCQDNVDRHIIIDLRSAYTIKSFIVQADANDAYLLYYRDLTSNSWQLAWTVRTAGGWGIQTRPPSANNEERYVLPNSIVTNALLLRGDMQNGDRLFSVSEIQAYGIPATK